MFLLRNSELKTFKKQTEFAKAAGNETFLRKIDTLL